MYRDAGNSYGCATARIISRRPCPMSDQKSTGNKFRYTPTAGRRANLVSGFRDFAPRGPDSHDASTTAVAGDFPSLYGHNEIARLPGACHTPCYYCDP
jgi:hypothetical protein